MVSLVQPSTMDRRVLLERFTTGTDEFGGETKTWGTLAAVWAERKAAADGERWKAGEVVAMITHRFRVRWSSELSDLGPKDRLTDGAKVHDIHGVKEIGRQKIIEITTSMRAE